MAALDPDGIGQGGRIVVFGSRARKVGEGQVGLSVAEAVVEERDVLPVQGPRAAQPVEHLLADISVCGIGAQGQDGQRRCLKRAVKRRLRERPQLGKALGQRREGKGLGPVSDGAGSRHYGVYRRILQFIENPHVNLPFAFTNVTLSLVSSAGLRLTSEFSAPAAASAAAFTAGAASARALLLDWGARHGGIDELVALFSQLQPA